MANLFTAKEVNAAITAKLKDGISELQTKGISPTLATVRIGENGSDVSYELGIAKSFNYIGVGIKNVVLPGDIAQGKLIDAINLLDGDPSVHGILLFQPIPRHLDEKIVKAGIAPEKDVDCATDKNLGAVVAGYEDCYPYCAPAAVMEMLDYYGVELNGATVTIVGSGLVVGKPLSMLLVNRFATVTICNVYTHDVPAYTRSADILISAAGVPGLITKEYVREGQIVIDVGTTFKNGKLLGDVNMAEVEPIVKAVTPTPGGISGVTTTVLAKHVVQAAQKINRLR